MITSIFTIISALLPLLVSTLESFKTISPTTGNLITTIASAATAFQSSVSSASSVSATSILTAISASLQVLKAELPTDGTASTALIYIAAIESAIAAGLAAINITEVDPTALKPVTAA